MKFDNVTASSNVVIEGIAIHTIRSALLNNRVLECSQNSSQYIQVSQHNFLTCGSASTRVRFVQTNGQQNKHFPQILLPD